MKSATIKSIDNLFLRLKNSHSFSLVGNISAAQFVTSHPWDKTLSEVSLAELVSLPGIELAEMTNATDAQLNALIKHLTPLAESDASFTTAQTSPFGLLGQAHSAQSSFGADTRQTESSSKGKRVFGIAEAEFKLKEAAKKLKLADPSPKLLLQSLEAFWPKNAAQSPFESSITLKAYLDLDHESLIKKRSMNSEKIDAILSALESATEIAYNEKKSLFSSFGGTASTSQFNQFANQDYTSSVDEELLNTSLTSSMSPSFALLMVTAPLIPALHSFLINFSKEADALELWNAKDIKKSLAKFPKKLRNEVTSWSERSFGPFNEPKDYPAYPLSQVLVTPPLTSSLSEPAKVITDRLLKIALCAAGYLNPSVNGKEIKELWATDSKALQKLVKACSALKNKKESVRLLRQAMPFLPEKLAADILKRK